MEKTSFRKWMIAKLLEVSADDKAQIENQLLKGLLQTSLWQNAKTIGITVSGGFEWETKSIIQAAWQSRKTVCVPKCLPQEKKLAFHRLTSFSELEKAHFNLLEPIPEVTETVSKNVIDLLLVPGIVFDKKGLSHRLWRWLLRSVLN
ncbi:5-formyltetrahydrofolate cyclo-ligase [Virgibacillus halophilus]|uniref:5-formyltetrahydrofolate cyclo-ligase n=1 Tax=Tigheibacillus halophilus TaxID=361280 RepID=A0ABU5CBK8_9BACI|nr:5-formyltetrahydrofolate cyclo-ligase [Virgibacillus halophilus]